MEQLEDLALPAVAVSTYAGGWVVTHTAVPARWQGYVSGVLLVVGVLAVMSGARALGLDVEGGRCRAATTDGTRCQLERDAGADLCHVHQRVHEVELHPSAVDGVVAAEDVDE